jgi:hypothetical protein
MLHLNEPNADHVMLAALLGAVGLMGGFAFGFYLAMQPTVIPNAGMVGYEAQQRRSNALMTATLTRESERLTIEFAQAENERQGLEKRSNQLPGFSAVTAPKLKQVVQAPRRERVELYAARSAPPAPMSPFSAFQGLFRLVLSRSMRCRTSAGRQG